MRAKLCAEAGCSKVVPYGQRYCEVHKARHMEQDAREYSARWAKASRAGDYHSARWREMKRRAVEAHPFCAMCGEKERLEVHHIRSVRLHPELMFDESNMMVLCHACHSAQTRREIRERKG